MKNVTEKSFDFRNYKITYTVTDGKIYLHWCSKSQAKYRYSGQHCCRCTSREDLARNLNNLRKDINHKWRRHMERVIEKRNAKASFVNPYFVGQVLHTSWGYDQTNIEYYQVTGIGKMSITIREIAQSCEEDSFMSGMTVPQVNQFSGEESTQIIQVYTWGHSVSDPSGHGLYEVSIKQMNGGIRSSWYA